VLDADAKKEEEPKPGASLDRGRSGDAGIVDADTKKEKEPKPGASMDRRHSGDAGDGAATESRPYRDESFRPGAPSPLRKTYASRCAITASTDLRFPVRHHRLDRPTLPGPAVGGMCDSSMAAGVARLRILESGEVLARLLPERCRSNQTTGTGSLGSGVGRSCRPLVLAIKG